MSFSSRNVYPCVQGYNNPPSRFPCSWPLFLSYIRFNSTYIFPRYLLLSPEDGGSVLLQTFARPPNYMRNIPEDSNLQKQIINQLICLHSTRQNSQFIWL